MKKRFNPILDILPQLGLRKTEFSRIEKGRVWLQFIDLIESRSYEDFGMSTEELRHVLDMSEESEMDDEEALTMWANGQFKDTSCAYEDNMTQMMTEI